MTTSERRPVPPASTPDDAPRDAAAEPAQGRTPASATEQTPPAARSRDEARAGEPARGRPGPSGPHDAHDGRQDEDTPAATAAEPITGEATRHSLNRDGQQGVHDRAASKGRRYAFDQNPSGEANDPSLTSGPTRERKV